MGEVSTIVGRSGEPGFADGVGLASGSSRPSALPGHPEGDPLAADAFNNSALGE